jgi:hypothetical protein
VHRRFCLLQEKVNDFEYSNAKSVFPLEDFEKIFPISQDSLDPIIPKGTAFAAAGLPVHPPSTVDSLYFGRKDTTDISIVKPDLDNGSNNWAVSGKKTESGSPILCNDPHLGLNLPAIWYEMQISDPVSFLFKNTDPRGSLRANVSNATVRCLSNMPLGEMLETRHKMSQTVRDEVSSKSQAWGYTLGSVYIRKVHFRDQGMIRQIEEKVVNRLRQVTSAIRQDGANQVSIITSTAERTAAIEFAKAAALRPHIVGAALQKIGEDPDVLEAMFEMLETQRLLEGEGKITFVPKGTGVLAPLITGQSQ